MLLLGALFAAQTVLIFGSLGWFAGSIGARLQRQPRLAVWLDRCAAAIFIGLALHLATAR
jgi:threonine/homoserine/homoserine lactone efflux protein